ncbi:hypothetical protein GCM10010400_38500 [Streptomyces aculeolatus]
MSMRSPTVISGYPRFRRTAWKPLERPLRMGAAVTRNHLSDLGVSHKVVDVDMPSPSLASRFAIFLVCRRRTSGSGCPSTYPRVFTGENRALSTSAIRDGASVRAVPIGKVLAVGTGWWALHLRGPFGGSAAVSEGYLPGPSLGREKGCGYVVG